MKMKDPDMMRFVLLVGMLFATQNADAQTIERPDDRLNGLFEHKFL